LTTHREEKERHALAGFGGESGFEGGILGKVEATVPESGRVAQRRGSESIQNFFGLVKAIENIF